MRAPGSKTCASFPAVSAKTIGVLKPHRSGFCYVAFVTDVFSRRIVGTRGDSYDNALAESVNGLFKAELIRRRGPWRTADDVELATLEWVDWWNKRRLRSACGDIPPAEFETLYYTEQATVPAA